jgi:hypothetical protein
LAGSRFQISRAKKQQQKTESCIPESFQKTFCCKRSLFHTMYVCTGRFAMTAAKFFAVQKPINLQVVVKVCSAGISPTVAGQADFQVKPNKVAKRRQDLLTKSAGLDFIGAKTFGLILFDLTLASQTTYVRRASFLYTLFGHMSFDKH